MHRPIVRFCYLLYPDHTQEDAKKAWHMGKDLQWAWIRTRDDSKKACHMDQVYTRGKTGRSMREIGPKENGVGMVR